jgi:CDP-2,3-bis-(O-geranylgeranyl)-sn-glycerol synthase
MHPRQIAELLILLTIANGAPVIAKKLLGDWLSQPLDAGLRLGDGQRLFGRSKTVRGVVLSIVATSAFAPLLGIAYTTGMLVAVAAMAGDLLSSFTKRRLHLQSSTMFIGLDQIPECLLPAIAARDALSLSLIDILLAAVIFLFGELAVSRVLYALRIREHPY